MEAKGVRLQRGVLGVGWGNGKCVESEGIQYGPSVW